MTKVNSLILTGCHVPLTAFYRLVKAVLNCRIFDKKLSLGVFLRFPIGRQLVFSGRQNVLIIINDNNNKYNTYIAHIQ